MNMYMARINKLMKTTVQATATTYLISYCNNQYKKLQDNADSTLELQCSTLLRQTALSMSFVA